MEEAFIAGLILLLPWHPWIVTRSDQSNIPAPVPIIVIA